MVCVPLLSLAQLAMFKHQPQPQPWIIRSLTTDCCAPFMHSFVGEGLAMRWMDALYILWIAFRVVAGCGTYFLQLDACVYVCMCPYMYVALGPCDIIRYGVVYVNCSRAEHCCLPVWMGGRCARQVCCAHSGGYLLTKLGLRTAFWPVWEVAAGCCVALDWRGK